MRLILSLLITLLCLSAHAQFTSQEPAVVVTKMSDTLVGIVNWTNEETFSNSFLFTENDKKNPIQYSPSDVKSIFLIKDSILFESIEFNYKSNGVDYSNKKMAKLIAKGEISLYQLQLPSDAYSKSERSDIYIIQKEGKYHTLSHGTGPKSKAYNRYKSTLFFLLQDGGFAISDFEHVAYSSEQITNLLNKYSASKHYNSLVVFNAKRKVFYSHQLRTGVMYASPYQGISFTSEAGNGYSVSYSLEILDPNISRRFYTNLELGYFVTNWPVASILNSNNDKVDNIHARGIKFLCSGVYKMRLHQNYPFLNFGFAIEKSNNYSFLPYFNIGVGAKKNKFSLLVQYERPFGLGKNFIEIKNAVYLKLGFAFLESKLK